MLLEVKKINGYLNVIQDISAEQLAVAMAVDAKLAKLISTAHMMHVTLNPVKVTQA